MICFQFFVVVDHRCDVLLLLTVHEQRTFKYSDIHRSLSFVHFLFLLYFYLLLTTGKYDFGGRA